jgi:di/tricarboxylate transporter
MPLNSSTAFWLTTAWFSLTYVGLALGRVPGLRIDRAGIALVGATLMMVTGLVPLPEAIRAVDYDTILLLFGMMVVVAFLRVSGFFERLAHWTVDRFSTPHALLAAIVAPWLLQVVPLGPSHTNRSGKNLGQLVWRPPLIDRYAAGSYIQMFEVRFRLVWDPFF